MGPVYHLRQICRVDLECNIRYVNASMALMINVACPTWNEKLVASCLTVSNHLDNGKFKENVRLSERTKYVRLDYNVK